MKKTPIIAFLLTLFATVTLAQGPGGENSVSSRAQLTEATIFPTGAELIHTASASLTQGVNTLEITGLSPVVDRSSVRIKAPDGIVISSYDFKVEILPAERIDERGLQAIKDSTEAMRRQVELLDIDIRITDQSLSILRDGVNKITTDNETPASIQELRETLEYYREEMTRLENSKLTLREQRQRLVTAVAELEEKYRQESIKNNRTEGVLTVNLTAPSSRTSEFTVTYFTRQAAWYPHYDINVEDIDTPVQIGLKSKVSQTTGLDWDNIRLTLSTSTPGTGMAAPIFGVWFLEPYVPKAPAARSSYQKSMVQNTLSYSVPEQEMVAEADHYPSSEPVYIINGVAATAEEYAALDPNMIADVQVMKAGSESVYGSRAANGVVVITTKSGLDSFIDIEDNTTGMVYNIDLPYTIPGNGREQTIDLETKYTEAEFKYYVAPKLDSQTFLVAEISDWSKLGLMTGKANVTFNGTYLGETLIDAASTSEKLSLTLGTDKRVVVTRVKTSDYSANRTVGNDVQQTFSYRITVRNNINRAIDIVVKDQYPRSTRKEIAVTLNTKEVTPWSYNNEEVGVLTWEERIGAGESRSFDNSYTVRYPKSMSLNF